MHQNNSSSEIASIDLRLPQSVSKDSALCAFVRVTFATGNVRSLNLKIIRDNKGRLFVAPPGHKNPNTQKFWPDIECTPNCRAELKTEVLGAYERILEENRPAA